MAIISNVKPVSDSEGGTWQVFGSVDTETGIVSFKIYGADGSILTEGSASKVASLINSLPAGPDNFVGKVVSAVNSMSASLKQSIPPPTSDTAANKIENTPPTAPSDTLTTAEQAKLSGDTIVDPDTGQILRVAHPGPGEFVLGMAPSEVTNSEPIKASTETNKKRPPLPNPLLAYPSYTYGLSLAMMTVDEYNKVVDNTNNYQSNRVIIASAGRYNNDTSMSMFKRAPFFAEDFYFENLDITTIIGFNDHSRATNAINLKFSIIEPYGITLLNRIIDLSHDIGSVNYIAQPYMLQIDFFGTNDAGEIVGIIPDQTKRIPIRILKMDIKASPKGAEYQIEASPYSHSAWDLSTVGTPAHFEITSGDIESFFKSNEPEIAFSTAKTQREKLIGANGRFQQATNGELTQRGGTGETVSLAFVGAGSAIDTNAIAGSAALFKVKSYGGALNAYYADLAVKDSDTVTDKYYFKIHDDIKKEGGFNLNAETLSSAQTPMASEENGMSIRGGEGTSLEHDVRIFAINTGTSIDQVISFAMRHTHYLQGQVQPASRFGADGKDYKAYLKKKSAEPLKWYKVVPTIKLLEYNIKQETWAREITYHILPYTVYNTKIPDAPQGVWTNPCKVHNYWYTGKNNDVLDFNIEFNALYYTAMTAYRENMSKTQNLNIDETKNAPLSKEVQQANSITPSGIKTKIADTQRHSTGGAVTVEAVSLADVESSLYTSAGGDMLQAKLKIIGDPQYIKQDDVFYPPVLTRIPDQADSTGIDPRLIANGSLHMDQGEIYVQVTVKSPVDIDESTGMMDFNPKYKTSLFSGMYRVLKVESTFSGGKFEQTVDMIRLPRQTSLESNDSATTDTNREVTAATPLLTNVDTAKDGPTSSTQTIVDDKAPGSNPIEDTTPPLQTAEEKALAKVDATATETPITTSTEPVAVPPPPKTETAADRLAIKQLSSTYTANGAAIYQLESQVASVQSQLESKRAQLDRLQSDSTSTQISINLAQSAVTRLTATVADYKSQLAAKQAEQAAYLAN